MYHDALNQLKADLLAAEIGDVQQLRSLFDRRLQQALATVEHNTYVEDCLFQIAEALEALQARPDEHLRLRLYLLGAIEALRDELDLCDVDMDLRQTAVGF
ncbi:hypothetical protein H6M51_13450 [Rhizobium sp. AQ_MP]|uniref:hypothetical protein n=1 Tax=Rhizobium sp. AQ_MP TaxID=2761536 RepID=UPI00163A27E6|nr:hypothetical protein [Rhizobium sp. AQ_MP]MBC2773865.1 hypothetical protein [Rhizobium sp. AQ_MP]